jgi:hypothetical protein
MANVQNIVGLVPALGVDGQQVVVGQAEHLAYNPLSDGTVKAGTFCFKKTNSGNGEKFALASLLGGAATDEPLGFVERVVDTRIDGANASTDVYPEGAALTVAIRGQYYITAPASIASDGLGVFINPLTGAISIAASARTGEVDTGWVCRIPNGGTSAASGDLVIVERF